MTTRRGEMTEEEPADAAGAAPAREEAGPPSGSSGAGSAAGRVPGQAQAPAQAQAQSFVVVPCDMAGAGGTKRRPPEPTASDCSYVVRRDSSSRYVLEDGTFIY